MALADASTALPSTQQGSTSSIGCLRQPCFSTGSQKRSKQPRHLATHPCRQKPFQPRSALPSVSLLSVVSRSSLGSPLQPSGPVQAFAEPLPALPADDTARGARRRPPWTTFGPARASHRRKLSVSPPWPPMLASRGAILLALGPNACAGASPLPAAPTHSALPSSWCCSLHRR